MIDYGAMLTNPTYTVCLATILTFKISNNKKCFSAWSQIHSCLPPFEWNTSTTIRGILHRYSWSPEVESYWEVTTIPAMIAIKFGTDINVPNTIRTVLIKCTFSYNSTF